MDYTTLGRTGLRVSVMGLGCGGHSRLGTATGGTEADAEQVVREALALGINFIDTAEAYGTEAIVGRAISGTPRDQVVLSTKVGVGRQGQRVTPSEMRERVDACLTRLQTDYVDIFHLHGVSLTDYSYAVETIVPELQAMQTQGKIRFLGITEAFASDPAHAMLVQAVQDDIWDVMMVGFNLLNQSARERVLTVTRAKKIGTLCMFAVRRALSRPEALRDLMQNLVQQGLVSAEDFNADDPLGFVTSETDAASLPEAAYRYCRWEPGLDVILSGTGQVAHLRENAHSLSLPPLPAPTLAHLHDLFAKVDTISGN